MRTKDYLKKYSELCGKVERYSERIEQIEASLMKSIQLDGLPHGSGTSDPTQQIAIKLSEIRSKLNIAMMEAELTRQTIAAEIEELENPIYRELLYLRYIHNGSRLMTWEKVTDKISEGRENRYDSKHVMSYMHEQALNAFEKTRKRSTLKVYQDELQK